MRINRVDNRDTQNWIYYEIKSDDAHGITLKSAFSNTRSRLRILSLLSYMISKGCKSNRLNK